MNPWRCAAMLALGLVLTWSGIAHARGGHGGGFRGGGRMGGPVFRGAPGGGPILRGGGGRVIRGGGRPVYRPGGTVVVRRGWGWNPSFYWGAGFAAPYFWGWWDPWPTYVPYPVPYPYPVPAPDPGWSYAPPPPAGGGEALPPEAGTEQSPPPDDPERATYGLIQLRGVPDGANVDLDGRFWLAAARLDRRWLAVPRGTHTVTVRVEGKEPVERTIEVDAGESQVVRFGPYSEPAARSPSLNTPPLIASVHG